MDHSALIQKLSDGDLFNIVQEVRVALAGSGSCFEAQRVIALVGNMCIRAKGEDDPVITDRDALQLTLTCAQAIERDAANHTKMVPHLRIVQSGYNVLCRFQDTGNLAYFFESLNALLPILEKMLPNVIAQEELSKIHKYFHLTTSILLSASESIFAGKSESAFSIFDLFGDFLRVSSLVSPDQSLPHIFAVMRSFLRKHENCHKSNVIEVVTLKRTLLERFQSFFETHPSKLIAEENVVNKIFGLLVNTLWQFLKADLLSGDTLSLHSTLSCFSKFVKSCLRAHFHHVECFGLITKVLETLFFKHPPTEKYFVCELKHCITAMSENIKEDLSPAFTWVVYICGQAMANMDHGSSSWIKQWRSFFTATVLTSIHQFMKLLSKLLLSCNNMECMNERGQVCPHKVDAPLALKSICCFVKLCVESIKENKEGQANMLSLIQESVASQQLILDKAIGGKCVKARQWGEFLCDNYRSLGTTFYNSKDWIYAQMFFRASLKYLYTNYEYSNRVASILSLYQFCCEKQGLQTEAKVSVLLYVVLNLKYGNAQPLFVCDQWASLQNADPACAKPADAFLRSALSLVKSMCPEFIFSEKLVPHLLIWELSCYVKHRMKSSDIILSTWIALKASEPTAVTLLEGSVLAGQALLSANDSINWLNLLSESVLTCFSQVNESEKALALCLLAAHYHLKFLSSAQSHFLENETKVDEPFYSRNPSTVRQPLDVIDPSDICQVKSTFPNLNLIREQMLMDSLDTAVNYWSESLTAGLCSEHHTMHSVVAVSGEYLLCTGFLYCLWGYHTGAAKAFKTCYKFAKKMSLNDLLLQALSGLMNVIVVKEDYITEADAILESLKDHPKVLYITQFYYTSKIYQALRTGSYSTGVELLKDVINFTPVSSHYWCSAYGKLLQAAYSVLPKSKLNNVKLDGWQSAKIGLGYCLRSMKQKTLSNAPIAFAASVDQALSISLWIGRYYLRCQMPRQARCFLKSELKLALKLGLASRAAEFVCELAFVDLLTENIDEAAAKIVDLQCILIDSNDYLENNGVNSASKYLLDVPTSLPERLGSDLGASPILSEAVFHLPIGSHESLCSCYLCRNYNVQNVWLMYSHLQAKISSLNFDVHKSHQIYNESLKAVRKILKKLGKPSAKGFLLQQHKLACTHIALGLDLCDMLVVYGKDQEAFKCNRNFLGLFRFLITDENQLFSEALEQKMCIINIMMQKEKEATCLSVPETTAVDEARTPPSIAEKNLIPPVTSRKRMPLTPVKTPIRNTAQTIVPFHTPKVGWNMMNTDEEKLPKENLTFLKRVFERQKNHPDIDHKTRKNLDYEGTERTEERMDMVSKAKPRPADHTKASKSVAAKKPTTDVTVSLQAATSKRADRRAGAVSKGKPQDSLKTDGNKNAAPGARKDKPRVPQKTTTVESTAVGNAKQSTQKRITRSVKAMS